MPIHFDVYGRRLVVFRGDDGYRVYHLGNEGKRRLAEDIVLPPDAPDSELEQHFEAHCHEWATPAHPGIRRLDEGA